MIVLVPVPNHYQMRERTRLSYCCRTLQIKLCSCRTRILQKHVYNSDAFPFPFYLQCFESFEVSSLPIRPHPAGFGFEELNPRSFGSSLSYLCQKNFWRIKYPNLLFPSKKMIYFSILIRKYITKISLCILSTHSKPKHPREISTLKSHADVFVRWDFSKVKESLLWSHQSSMFIPWVCNIFLKNKCNYMLISH